MFTYVLSLVCHKLYWCILQRWKYGLFIRNLRWLIFWVVLFTVKLNNHDDLKCKLNVGSFRPLWYLKVIYKVCQLNRLETITWQWFFLNFLTLVWQCWNEMIFCINDHLMMFYCAAEQLWMWSHCYCLYVQLAKMIDLGSNAAVRDLHGLYTVELTTETDIAGIQRNTFQVTRNNQCFWLVF